LYIGGISSIDASCLGSLTPIKPITMDGLNFYYANFINKNNLKYVDVDLSTDQSEITSVTLSTFATNVKIDSRLKPSMVFYIIDSGKLIISFFFLIIFFWQNVKNYLYTYI